MKSTESSLPRGGEDDDLSRRVARYRARLEAEGRVNSLKVLDKAMKEVAVSSDRGGRGRK